MSAWGTTGRVMLRRHDVMDSDVLIDGGEAGWVGVRSIPGLGPWVAGRSHLAEGAHLPSLDAAVMWVLRRAAPDVWRQERGPVWQVMSCPSPSLGPGWDAWLPGGSEFGHYATHAAAMKAATP